MLPRTMRNLMHRAGFDVARWPRRPDDGVLDWALDAVLTSREINCVIDVGGNRGHFGERLRALGYRCRIVSFEPSPSTLPVIKQAAARDGRWEVRPVGLSASPGTAELRLHEGPELDSLLTAIPGVADQIPIMAETGTATVSLSTLAGEFPAIVAGIGSPRVLVKSDTQGHDATTPRRCAAPALADCRLKSSRCSWNWPRSRSTTTSRARPSCSSESGESGDDPCRAGYRIVMGCARGMAGISDGAGRWWWPASPRSAACRSWQARSRRACRTSPRGS